MRKITTCKGVELLVPQKGEKHPNAGRPKGAKNVMTRVLKDANRHGNLERMSAARWFVKCALSAALLLIACGLATAWFGNRLQVPATTTRDGTLITLNGYADEPIPDIVLVGSSLTFRLKEDYFAAPHLRNLGLAGGSPVTGLDRGTAPSQAGPDRGNHFVAAAGRWAGRELIRAQRVLVASRKQVGGKTRPTED